MTGPEGRKIAERVLCAKLHGKKELEVGGQRGCDTNLRTVTFYNRGHIPTRNGGKCCSRARCDDIRLHCRRTRVSAKLMSRLSRSAKVPLAVTQVSDSIVNTIFPLSETMAAQ